MLLLLKWTPKVPGVIYYLVYMWPHHILIRGGGAVSRSSRLHLIDLAGSERQKKTKAQGVRIKQECMMNKSLSTQENVNRVLGEN